MAKQFPGRRLGRFSVFQRTDDLWIVYDPARPFADGTAFGPTSDYQAALDALEELSAAADARGEPNRLEKRGYARDWSDPASWD